MGDKGGRLVVAILGLGAISGCSSAMKLTPNDADVVLSRQLGCSQSGAPRGVPRPATLLRERQGQAAIRVQGLRFH